jgi:hypothetical protein
LAAVAGLPAELTRRLDTVSRNPLLRCYVKLVDSASARPPNYAAATQTVLRRALPTADPRWVQVSYTDHIPAERLYNLLTNVHGRAVLQAHAAPIVAPDAWTELDLHFWKAGTHSWRPKQTADCHYEHVLQPDPTAPLFVVGACFSHAQHWIEGALETAGDAVRALRRLWRVSSRPATRRTMKASATCPVQRVPLRAWAMDDVVAHGHVVYANKVYDISEIAPLHPGGAKILTNARGTDVTRAFHGVGHSVTAKAWLDQHCVGTLSPST